MPDDAEMLPPPVHKKGLSFWDKVLKGFYSSQHAGFSDYLMLFIALMLSGNPAATELFGGTKIALTLLMLLLAAVLLFRRCGAVSQRGVIVFGAFLGLEVWHWLIGNPEVTCLGVITRLLAAMFLVMLLNERFIMVFVRLMLYLSYISIFFFGLLLLGVPQYFYADLQHLSSMFGGNEYMLVLGIHSYPYDMTLRNSGCFWEPGAFAGYLSLALLLMVFKYHKRPFKEFAYPFIVIGITLLTTLSTTGYFALYIVCFALFISKTNIKNMFLMVCAGILGIVIMFYVFQNVTFMSEKLVTQIEMVDNEAYGWEMTRLGTLVHDYSDIKRRWLLGWGSNLEFRYGAYQEEIYLRKGNGFSDFWVKNGTIGLFIYMYGLWLYAMPMCNRNKLFSALFVLTVLVLLQGEMFLNYPIFMAIMFLGYSQVTGEEQPENED